MRERKKDEGVSEVISFVMILAMLILAFAVWAMYAVPAGGERMEEIHTVNIQMEFSEFKSEIENVWLSNNPGVVRESVFVLSPDVAESGLQILAFPLTQASGTVSIQARSEGPAFTDGTGVVYRPLTMRYAGANVYTEAVDLRFFGLNNSVVSFGPGGEVRYVLPGSERYLVMVMEDTRLELSGTGRAVVEYRLLKVEEEKKGTESVWYCLFDVGVRK